jgi:hypothetical protein
MTLEIWLLLLASFIGTSLLLFFKGKSIIESIVTVFATSIGITILVVFALSYGVFTWGLVFWKFWYWFFLPVFPDFPELTFLQAIGLMFVVDLFKNQSQISIKKEYTDEKTAAIMPLIVPLLTLGLGWLFKHLFLT